MMKIRRMTRSTTTRQRRPTLVLVLLLVLAVVLGGSTIAAFTQKFSGGSRAKRTAAPSTSRRFQILPVPSSSTRLGSAASASSSTESELQQQQQQQHEQNDDPHEHREPCNVVFTHTNADFDSLAAAVALSLLWSHETPTIPTHVVLPRGVHPIVQRFLAFHKHVLPIRGFKTIQAEDVHAIGVVDAQSAARIGRGRAWLDHARSIHVYDHHDSQGPVAPTATNDSNDNTETKTKKKEPPTLLERATNVVIDKVGSTTTLLVERLKDAGISPAPHEATLFCLGIRADTGGLVYEGTTLRDAAALVWCLEQGASQVAISEFGIAKIVGDTQRAILQEALGKTQTSVIHGRRVSSVLVTNSIDDSYVAGLAQVCEEILDLTDSDVFVLGATHRSGKNNNKKKKKGGGRNNKGAKEDDEATQWISLIGRASARAVGVDLNAILRQFGGGGHPKAAAAALRCRSMTTPNEHDGSDNTRGDDDGEDGEASMTTPSSSSLDDLVQAANSGELLADQALETVVTMIQSQIPEQLVASSFMVPVSHVATVGTDWTVAQAKQLFDDKNLKSAPVVDMDTTMRFRSSLKYNDLVKAVRAGRSEDRIKGMIRPGIETVLPETNLAELERLIVHEGIGRIPVVDDDGALVGIVTRTDVLRQRNFYGDSDVIVPKLK